MSDDSYDDSEIDTSAPREECCGFCTQHCPTVDSRFAACCDYCPHWTDP